MFRLRGMLPAGDPLNRAGQGLRGVIATNAAGGVAGVK